MVAVQARSLSRKEAMWVFIEENTIVNAFILLIIVFSTTCFVLETEFRDEALDIWWFIFETVSVTVFSIEFCIRIISCPHLRHFVLSPLNIIDLLAIIPYYITLFWAFADGVDPWNSSASQVAKSTTVLRAIRLFRVFRIFKLGRYSSGLQVFVGALTHSATSLFLLCFLLLITVVLFSSIMYLVESDGGRMDHCFNSSETGDGDCIFESIPSTFWWAIVTVTTVGYGDAVPGSILGKVIAALAMICGIIVIALPISVLGNNFTKLMQQYSDESIVITQADLDGSGYVDLSEVARWLIEMRKAGKIRDERLTAESLIERYDKGGKVGLERKEFLRMCRETVHQGGPSHRELLQKMIRLGDQLGNIQERLGKLEKHVEASTRAGSAQTLLEKLTKRKPNPNAQAQADGQSVESYSSEAPPKPSSSLNGEEHADHAPHDHQSDAAASHSRAESLPQQTLVVDHAHEYSTVEEIAPSASHGGSSEASISGSRR